MLLKLIVLSLGRRARRTALVVAGIALSVFLMVFMGGMMEGMRSGLLGRLVGDGGHVQAFAAGYEKRLDPYAASPRIADADSLAARIAALTDPAGRRLVERAEPVITYGALLIAGDRSLTMGGIGVDADTGYYESIRHGIRSGSFLAGGAEGFLLSTRAATLLEAKVGDRVAVLVEDSTGSPYYLDLPVRGLFDSGSSETDDAWFLTTLAAARDLLGLGAHEATEVRAWLFDPREADSVAAAVRGTVPGLFVRTYREANGGLLVFVDLFDVFVSVINGVIAVAAAFMITNALLGTLLERVREIGTLRAIGFRRRVLAALLTGEGLAQGVAGGLLGLAVGVPLVLLLERRGLALGALNEIMTAGGTLYFHLSLSRAVGAFALGAAIAGLCGLYAARVVLKRTVVESLRAL